MDWVHESYIILEVQFSLSTGIVWDSRICCCLWELDGLVYVVLKMLCLLVLILQITYLNSSSSPEVCETSCRLIRRKIHAFCKIRANASQIIIFFHSQFSNSPPTNTAYNAQDQWAIQKSLKYPSVSFMWQRP